MSLLLLLLAFAFPGDLIQPTAVCTYESTQGTQYEAQAVCKSTVVLSPAYRERPVYLALGWHRRYYNRELDVWIDVYDHVADGMLVRRVMPDGSTVDGIQLSDGGLYQFD